MKTTFIFLIILSYSLNANTDNKKPINIPPISAKKIDYTPLVKVKYSLSLSKRYDLKYSLVMPMKKENLSILSNTIKKNRFEAKPLLQPRFRNTENIDLASIVERNKMYNLSKTIQIRTY
ncbi:MAG: hypothetical protein JNL75_00240 [Chitinophagales bacterium]|nr:hypothetical protein [Chitinophagales bacterium]